jgi:hypothetical protein
MLLLSTLLLLTNINIFSVFTRTCRSRCPRGLRRGSATTRLLGLRVWIPPRAWMFVSCECRVLTVGGLWICLITRPEESYRVRCVQWVWKRSPVMGGHDRNLVEAQWGGGGESWDCVLITSGKFILKKLGRRPDPYANAHISYVCPRQSAVDSIYAPPQKKKIFKTS